MTRCLVLICLWLTCASASAKTISNVTVCAISCNGEFEVKTAGEDAQAGTVYFATYSNTTKADPGFCMSQAHSLPTYEYKAADLEGLAQKGCSEILHDKFFGKKVDLVVAEGQVPRVTEVIIR